MLNRLDIENFRVLQDLHVEKLGHVNLIVGKNNAGKSTVLEAVRIFAGNGQRRLLDVLAYEHDERIRVNATDDNVQIPPHFTFDFMYNDSTRPILIGDKTSPGSILTMQNVHLVEFQEMVVEEGISRAMIKRRRVEDLSRVGPDDTLRRALAINKAGKGYYMMLDSQNRASRLLDQAPTQACGIVPTHLVTMDELAQAWDKVVFSEDEKLVTEAIRFIAPDFDALTFVEMEDYDPERAKYGPYNRSRVRRVPVVKTSSNDGPLPLKSLGDGVSRVLQLSLKILEAKNGFLLIDEFENGFHYTVQEVIWRFIFRASSLFNIQVFATTHSWDCVKSFAQATQDTKGVEGLLFRVGKSVRTSDRGKVIATEFYGDDLYRINQSDLEVR